MAFIRVHPCASIRMGALQSSRMPSRAWLRYARAKKPAKSRSLKASWAVFIVLGILLYSHGREAGYQRGKSAGKAVARNIAEGLGGAVLEPAPSVAPIEAPAVFVDPPIPPPM